jgi:hypothetical protein
MECDEDAKLLTAQLLMVGLKVFEKIPSDLFSSG